MPNPHAATLARVAEIEDRATQQEVVHRDCIGSCQDRVLAQNALWLCGQLRAALGEEAAAPTPASGMDLVKLWDDSGEAECFRRIQEAVGSGGTNAKHAAQWGCDVFGQWLRAALPRHDGVERGERCTVSG